MPPVVKIVLHPPNVTSVLRYFGPTRTWFFSSFKLLLVRYTQSQCIRPTVGRLHSFLKLAALFCRSDAQLK